jgi:hypothetical protein
MQPGEGRMQAVEQQQQATTTMTALAGCGSHRREKNNRHRNRSIRTSSNEYQKERCETGKWKARSATNDSTKRKTMMESIIHDRQLDEKRQHLDEMHQQFERLQDEQQQQQELLEAPAEKAKLQASMLQQLAQLRDEHPQIVAAAHVESQSAHFRLSCNTWQYSKQASTTQ